MALTEHSYLLQYGLCDHRSTGSPDAGRTSIILPYEFGTPAVFGFAEWNGRSLTDNAPNVMFSIAVNTPFSLGIGKESVTSKPSTTFPYVPSAS